MLKPIKFVGIGFFGVDSFLMTDLRFILVETKFVWCEVSLEAGPSCSHQVLCRLVAIQTCEAG